MPTANERFKASFTSAFWYALALATVAHFLLLAYGPAFALERYDRDAQPPIFVQPASVDLPPPPDVIPRPALPVMSAQVAAEVTIPTVPFDRYLPPPPPPPPAAAGGDALRADFEKYVPSMTAPRILNAAEVERALQRHYPTLLRDAGIEGSVGVELWLDEQGGVVQARVARSSGYQAMDEAALHVVDTMRLSPAANRGRAVRVIVHLPVVFRVH